jgi:putative ABC transport system ATP-binding protein
MDLALKARDLTKTFHNGVAESTILRGVTLDLQRGEFVALMGPSGCGKSTLLNILGLAELPTSGEVCIGGASTSNASQHTLQTFRREKLGYVFQQFNLLSTLTVRENVMVPLILTGVEVDAADVTAEEVLARVGLRDRADAMPFTLSGGEKQRVAIARAVAHKPLVILADEPTGILDSRTGSQVLELLREQTELGIAILMATHSEAASAGCSRTLHMRDGVLE